MSATNFQLPKTKNCVVVWYRAGVRNEVTIPTPASNDSLVMTMVMKHKVGRSEIRTIKGVEADLSKLNVRGLALSMMGC